MAETHEIVLIPKKPSSAEINQWVRDYFEIEAQGYDEFTHTANKRKNFVGTVNSLVAEELKKQSTVSKALAIACGTGAREKSIFDSIGTKPQITGVDVSPQMCSLAAKNGLHTLASSWLDADLNKQVFDAAFYLHSFGLASNTHDRKSELQKIAQHLKSSAPLFIDVLNLNDTYEWGPQIQKMWQENDLAKTGLELGDVFYRRIGKTNISFYHYFSATEMRGLLEDAGFAIKQVFYIGYGARYGEIVGPNEGAMLFVTIRK
jgi:ubiquinone/menaquinone biosynthesis C-methylase UbiE